MTWLFFVLILSTLAVAWVGIAAFLRVRRHMKPAAGEQNHGEGDHSPGEA